MIQPMKLAESRQTQKDDSELSFATKAAAALGISIIADGLDYVSAPIFALPVVGDIADLIVMGLLYRITKSKVSVFVNAIEFIPFVGDFVPTYTISTLMWILRESQKRKNQSQHSRLEAITVITEPPSIVTLRMSPAGTSRKEGESLETRIMRAYCILRSRMF